MRVPKPQHCDVLLGWGWSETLQSKSRRLMISRLFLTDFLPGMASDHTSTTYKLELLKK